MKLSYFVLIKEKKEKYDEDNEKSPIVTDSDINTQKREGISRTTSKRNSMESKSFKFFSRVEFTLGKGYSPVHASHLLQMGLIIYAKTIIVDKLSGFDSASEATGLGGIIGNKGGLVASFNVGNVSLCFCTSHLAAHRGIEYREKRHNDVSIVLKYI